MKTVSYLRYINDIKSWSGYALLLFLAGLVLGNMFDGKNLLVTLSIGILLGILFTNYILMRHNLKEEIKKNESV